MREIEITFWAWPSKPELRNVDDLRRSSTNALNNKLLLLFLLNTHSLTLSTITTAAIANNDADDADSHCSSTTTAEKFVSRVGGAATREKRSAVIYGL